MGIKNLKVLISKYAREAINERFLYLYNHKIIAIDISIYLYRYIYINGEPLELLTKQIMRLLKNQVIPLYIFDGKPPKEKDDVINERKQAKKELITQKEKISDLILKKEKLIEGDDTIMQDNIIKDVENKDEIDIYMMDIDELKAELNKVDKKIVTITNNIIESCKKLFNLMGIPYIVAQGEAESLCAKLIKENIVYGCISEDTDILANGGRYFLRNFNVYNNKVIEYDLDKILTILDLKYEEFIDVCILCGCDYTPSIKNIGIEKAYKFVKIYKNIENIIEYIEIENNKNIQKGKPPRYIIPTDFNYQKARELFFKCGENEDCQKIKDSIQLKEPKLNELLNYLDEMITIKINLKNDLIRNLQKYSNTLMKNNEITLDQFYKIS